ncbi:MAG: anaerobic ribonucleoside-triphosphate reductase activating protein [Candidatus Altiarchaeota archaeon]|nr:anaerobic ribonucleoside-triphosphate reductase activating protein [Candidatus Altiarchaeota archaeon]
MKVKIGGLIKSSLIDYPSKLSAVIFFQGCNFRCPSCYNTNVVLPEKFGDLLDIEETLTFLKKRRTVLDAVVLLGGEPLIQPGLEEFVIKLKDLGYLVKLDTNGSDSTKIRRMFSQELLDYVAMDVKSPLDFQSYQAVSNCSKKEFEQVLKSIRLLKAGQVKYEFRTTLVPGQVEMNEVLRIAEQLKGSKQYIVQNFFSQAPSYVDDKFKQKNSFSRQELEKLANEVQNRGWIGTVDVR